MLRVQSRVPGGGPKPPLAVSKVGLSRPIRKLRFARIHTRRSGQMKKQGKTNKISKQSLVADSAVACEPARRTAHCTLRAVNSLMDVSTEMQNGREMKVWLRDAG